MKKYWWIIVLLTLAVCGTIAVIGREDRENVSMSQEDIEESSIDAGMDVGVPDSDSNDDCIESEIPEYRVIEL